MRSVKIYDGAPYISSSLIIMKNRYIFLRHGQALSNIKSIVSCWPERFFNHLTKKGRKQAEISSQRLKKEKINLIFSSDILRTKQTAEIVGKTLGIRPKFDKRLREYNVGILNGKPVKEIGDFFDSQIKRFEVKPPKGETYQEIVKRMFAFFEKTEKNYSEKNILIISHEVPLTLLEGKIKKLKNKEIFQKFTEKNRIKTGEWRKIEV